MKALAIDFGGTHATYGLVEDQTILAHETIHTDRAKAGAAPQSSRFHLLLGRVLARLHYSAEAEREFQLAKGLVLKHSPEKR